MADTPDDDEHVRRQASLEKQNLNPRTRQVPLKKPNDVLDHRAEHSSILDALIARESSDVHDRAWTRAGMSARSHNAGLLRMRKRNVRQMPRRMRGKQRKAMLRGMEP